MSKPQIDTNELTELEIKILQNLGHGFSNAILLKHLAKKCGFINECGTYNERKIRLAIESLRQKEWAILSGDLGYFICATPEEKEAFINYQVKEIRSRCKMLKTVIKACNSRLEKSVQYPMFLK